MPSEGRADAFADQALLSATAFLLMAGLARSLGPADLGIFVVGYTILLLVVGLQVALFAQPHNVLAVAKSESDYRDYTSNAIAAQVVCSFFISLVLVLGHQVLSQTGSQFDMTVAWAATVGPFWSSQDFIRRVLYTKSKYRTALKTDLVYAGVMGTLLIALGVNGNLNTSSAMATLAVAYASALGFGLWQMRSDLVLPCAATMRAALRENWQFGKWLVGSSLAAWISGQLYLILVAGFAGPASSGGLRAAQNLVSPTNILGRTIESVLPAKAAQAYTTKGPGGLLHEVQNTSRTPILVATCYYLAISISSGPLIRIAFGADFASYSWLVWVVSVGYWLALLLTVVSSSLMAMSKTRILFMANSISAGFSVTAGVWMVAKWGLHGVSVGLIFNALLVNLILWLVLLNTVRQPSKEKRQ